MRKRYIKKHTFTKRKGIGKMRNKFIVLAVSSLLVCSTAFAETTLSGITPAEGVVTVTGKTDSEVITYEVYDKDVTTPTKTDIVGFGEKYTDGEDFTITFGLKNSGTFKIRLFDGATYVSDEFDYASASARAEFAEVTVTNILKTPATAATALGEELGKSANAAVIKTIGMGSYLGYSDDVKEAICIKMAADGANKALNERALLTLYSEAEALVRLNKLGTTDAKEVLTKLNYTFESVAHNDIASEAQRTWIEQAVAKNAPYSSLNDVEKMYGKACALYVINNAKITNIEEKVKGYASLLEITGNSKYTGYTSKASSTVNRKLVEELAKTEANTVSLLLDALNTAAGTSSGLGGSGGGVGGGGFSSVSGSKPTTNSNYVVNKTDDENPSEDENTQNTSIFTDVSANHWAYSAISALKSEGIVSGYGDGSFNPDQTVTREEFVKMIVAAFKLENENAKSHFHDVFDSDWFYPYVSAAYEKGIVLGDNLGLFGVHADITRQDATVIAARAMRLAGFAADAAREYPGFNDEYAISDYAKEDIKTLYCAGKINGTDKGSFEPQRCCTRAEAAAIIYGISR